MIQVKDIEPLIRDAISGTEVFLVEAAVKQGNNIRVFVDEPDGISLDECVRISRAIEAGIDREKEDFDIQVLKIPCLLFSNMKRISAGNLRWKLLTIKDLQGSYLMWILQAFPLMQRSGLKPKAQKRVKLNSSLSI